MRYFILKELDEKQFKREAKKLPESLQGTIGRRLVAKDTAAITIKVRHDKTVVEVHRKEPTRRAPKAA